jgi:hypothetical protein
MTSNYTTDELNRMILQVISKDQPQSVKQLLTILKGCLSVKEEEIIKVVMSLQAQGIIKLQNPRIQPQSFASYLRTREAVWYEITIASAVITCILIFIIPENVYPLTYLRNVFGIIFILLLPGYTLIKALYPVNTAVEPAGNLDSLERISLSFGVSITLVSIFGLLFNFSPWGLDLRVLILTLLVFTLAAGTSAIAREYFSKKSTQ